MSHFELVKEYLHELEYEVLYEDKEEELVVVANLEAGVTRMVIDCEDPILVMEHHLFDLNGENQDVFKELLMKNREIIHGAFALDESGIKVLFRDTLQIENLDKNELEGSLNSLALLLSEYSTEIIKFAKL